ncbi:class I SAM-dependent methyltransferase [Enterovibrio paralichthyis]|uniref:class I SAM-dependent methyltransferase n=1 Tax=Enterovibrio paralichthyis TaxID=2853805 RepID=UPI001C437BE1|nr:class I SAM-dependent methyltransferase [Enterovibrio paralichthyis]MBV7299038.1 class I SAM-dependent methyltransferase [Enterovibrio paralichthyis]
MSVDFYNQNAQAFFDSTKEVDVSSLLAHFTPHLPNGASVLDAGCGSGRDSKRLLEMGYAVTSFDASTALAAIAEGYIQQSVSICTFADFESDTQFDGIWACASLLHVPASELPSTFAHLASLLKTGGTFYCSFKYGSSDTERDGRYFTNCDEARLESFIQEARLAVHETWQTTDLRPGREEERWLNAILIKQ